MEMEEIEAIPESTDSTSCDLKWQGRLQGTVIEKSSTADNIDRACDFILDLIDPVNFDNLLCNYLFRMPISHVPPGYQRA